MSSFFIAMATISFHGIAAERLPAASGLSNFVRIVGGAFAASVVTTYWDRHAALHQTQLVARASGLDPGFRAALRQLRDLGLSQAQALAALGRTVGNQAYANSAFDFFRMSAAMALALVLLVWLTRRASGRGPVAAAAD